MLTGDVRALTLRIALPSLAALLSSSLCTLLEALVLSRNNTQLSAAVGVSWHALAGRAVAERSSAKRSRSIPSSPSSVSFGQREPW